jgi:acyl-CoA thioesterase-2
VDRVLADLLKLLTLEQVEDNIFRGESRDIGSPQVYGGQVLGQALRAASKTVDGRGAHSLHAYFLRRGDVEAPIVYEVDRARDGSSFSNRRVVAIQHGRQIFNMTASFQRKESGLEHQATMPDVPGPDGLTDFRDIKKNVLAKLPERVRRFLTIDRPFDVRPVDMPDILSNEKLEPVKHIWMRTKDSVPHDEETNQVLLAYVSDYELLGTATLPHGLRFVREQVQMASLDHALWFHHSCHFDQWLLFSFDSPSASGARGLSRGQVFTQDGILVASTAQEGLMRVRKSS